MSEHTANEEALLYQAANGDINAFEFLIIKYEKLIFNIAYRILNNVEDARDATQEALIKIYNNIHKCGDIKSFKSWICRITTNTCIDELRRRKTRKEEHMDKIFETEEGSSLLQFESKEPTPEETAIKRELQREIRQAINLLPEKYKILIVLRDLNGLSYEELARITGLSMGTVKSRLSRARTKLQKNLEDTSI